MMKRNNISIAFVDYKKSQLNDYEKELFKSILVTNFDVRTVFSSHENYSAFFSLFCKGSMMASQFKAINIDNFEQKLTVSNEAFCLLALDNAFERWRAECDKKLSKNPAVPDLLLGKSNQMQLSKDEQNELPLWRYTSQNIGAVTNGWSNEGKRLYMTLHDLCTSKRRLEDKKCRYTFALANCKDLKSNSNKRRKTMSFEAREDSLREEKETEEALRKHSQSVFAQN